MLYVLRYMLYAFGDRLVVGHQVLVLATGVRIPVPELNCIKKISVLIFCNKLGISQDALSSGRSRRFA